MIYITDKARGKKTEDIWLKKFIICTSVDYTHGNVLYIIIKYLTKENSFFYILMDLLGFDIVKEFLLGGESFRTQDAKEIEKCHIFVYK